jgi:predicted benzoate:H+ symporter BenE
VGAASYLSLLFVCLLCHQLRAHGWVAWLWPSFVGLSLAFLAACYIYQFPDVQAWLEPAVGTALLRDVGLVANPPPQLFAYLLQVRASHAPTRFDAHG